MGKDSLNKINPNRLFDYSQENHDSFSSFNDVLNSGEFFRYREDGVVSKSCKLEEQLAAYVGQEACMLVCNGTTGLEVALWAVGVRPGDRVLVSAYSYIASSLAVVNIGAMPIPLDMGSDLSVSIPAEHIAQESISAAVVVHIQGHAIDFRDFFRWCEDRKVPIVEDICQAFGAIDVEGHRTGSIGCLSVTSFQQSKQLCAGEGGAIFGSEQLIRRIRSRVDLGAVRTSGGLPRWDLPESGPGNNRRLSELQAALVLDQFERLPLTLEVQQSNRMILWEASNFVSGNVSRTRSWPDTGSHTLFLAHTNDSAQHFIEVLHRHGVHSYVVWPVPFPEHPVYDRILTEVDWDASMYSSVSSFSRRMISIPTPKYLTKEDAESIGTIVRKLRNDVTEG
jgi:pilin glycosylation protein pglC